MSAKTKSKRKHEEHENHERWLVSYADFITLLFAFFVVMYATSTNNEEKQKKFEESVRENLKLNGSGGSGQGKQESNSSQTLNLNELVPELNTPLTSFPRRGGPKEVEDYVDRSLDKKMTRDERKKSVTGLRHDAVGVRISLAASSFFPMGSAKLKYSSLKSLDQIAELLKESNKKIIIEGHTDNTPVAGGIFESNWELASLRATTVVRYLIKYHKVDPKNLAAISYADQKPIADNDSEEGRAKNRRIEVLISTEN